MQSDEELASLHEPGVARAGTPDSPARSPSGSPVRSSESPSTPEDEAAARALVPAGAEGEAAAWEQPEDLPGIYSCAFCLGEPATIELRLDPRGGAGPGAAGAAAPGPVCGACGVALLPSDFALRLCRVDCPTCPWPRVGPLGPSAAGGKHTAVLSVRDACPGCGAEQVEEARFRLWPLPHAGELLLAEEAEPEEP